MVRDGTVYKASRLERMTTKAEAAYLDLRERILFGELPAGSPFSAKELMNLTGVNITMARKLLLSLKSGGYLTRSGPSYVISSFTIEQVEEWRVGLGAIVEIGALRMALERNGRLQSLTTFLNTHIRGVPVNQEAFFLGALGLTRIVLGGDQSALSNLVGQLVPQVFFRLLWMSDSYADRTGFLVEASDRFLVAAESGDLEGVRSASHHFFDGIAPALHKLVANMAEGIYPANNRKDGFQTIEAKITGVPTYADSSKAWLMMLEPLADIDRTAQAL